MTADVSGTMLQRRRLVVHGVVQGVGFRPHVVRLAASLGLAGSCRNDATSVIVEVEGPGPRIDVFAHRLRVDAPALARILRVVADDLAPTGDTGFAITSSTTADGARTLVPADTAVCVECLAEMADPADRRHRHPFITCTGCGPRFTITRDLPYDRPVTTMAPFAMCAACAVEYADPADRRHHAQPISCHDCGPTLRVCTPDGTEIAAGTEDSLRAVVAALRGGAIVAIKGIGGYHLSCDALSCTAATVLRVRKQRPDQPFAVMARDLATAATLVDVGDAACVLSAPERPIVLLPRRADAPVAECVAPGLDELGVLLPYAPLHHLLFADFPDGSPGAPPVLVMTSGNLSGEPLCFDDAEALARLGGVADVFLTHDREIAVPCEDSVVGWLDGAPVPLRRSRGFAPLPVVLADGAGDEAGVGGVVLAAGAEVKNTVALARDGLAFVSAHVGDLGTLESRRAHAAAVAQLLRFHRSSPDLVVADLHPAYASRAWARGLARDLGVPLLDVQHHHAHLAALAAEHGRLGDPLLGVVFDGTGYGCDARVWGGELLVLGDNGRRADRVAHLDTVYLAGGDEGVRNPVRTAALALLAAGLDPAGTPVGDALTQAEAAALPGLLATGTGLVPTSSVGRLFDIVSALLGVRARVTYEAQAAIELEVLARRWHGSNGSGEIELPFPVTVAPATGLPALDPGPLVGALTDAVRAGVDRGQLAWSFHMTLARATCALAADQAAVAGVGTVGLTGGVFANRVLLTHVTRDLRERGLEVLTHRLVPANDGGLALGQVAVGARVLQQRRQERP
ncbi:carbamoyltransferase HypF [soil metagenome]